MKIVHKNVSDKIIFRIIAIATFYRGLNIVYIKSILWVNPSFPL